MKTTVYYCSFPFDLYTSSKNRHDKIKVDKAFIRSLTNERFKHLNLQEVEIPNKDTYILYSTPFLEPMDFIEGIVTLWANRYIYKAVCSPMAFMDILIKDYPEK